MNKLEVYTSETEMLKAEIERLRKALKPFADLYEKTPEWAHDKFLEGGWPVVECDGWHVEVLDFRKASEVLENKPC